MSSRVIVRRAFACAVAVGAGLAVAGSALAVEGPITFNPPADAPFGNAFGKFGALEVTANGGVGDQDAARASLSGGGTRFSYFPSVVNIFNTDNRGHFVNDANYATPGLPSDTDNIAAMFRAYVQIPTTGTYTFGVTSDDGFTLAFDNGTSPFTSNTNGNGANLQSYNGTANGALQFYGGRGTTDSFGQINLTAGAHQLDLTFHEGGGGSSVELYASAGNRTIFGPSFNLVGGSAVAARPSKIAGVGPFTLKEYDNATDLQNILNAGRASGATTATLRATNQVQALRFTDPSNPNTGSHTADAISFPADPQGNQDNFGGFATAQLVITAGNEGIKTFNLYTDDETSMRIRDNATGVYVPLAAVFNADQRDSDGNTTNDEFGKFGACCGDFLGQYNLAVGTYTIEAAFKEGGGGSGFFLYGANGAFGSFDTTNFDLLGGYEGTPAGLAVIPEPASVGLLGLAAVGLIARRRRRCRA